MTHWLKEYGITPHDRNVPRHDETTTCPAEDVFEAGRSFLPVIAHLVVPRILQELADDPDKYKETYEVTYQPFGDEVQGRGMEIRIGNLSPDDKENYRVRLGVWPRDEDKILRLYQGRRDGWMAEHGYGNGAAHGHGYAIASLPVVGSQRDKVIAIEETEPLADDIETVGDQFRVFTLDAHGIPGKSDHLINEDGKTVRLTTIENRVIQHGQLYTMPPERDFVHAVTNGKSDPALTISLNGNRVEGEKTIVYFRGDGQPIVDERIAPTSEVVGSVALQMIKYFE